jgi:hypothetical protein
MTYTIYSAPDPEGRQKYRVFTTDPSIDEPVGSLDALKSHLGRRAADKDLPGAEETRQGPATSMLSRILRAAKPANAADDDIWSADVTAWRNKTRGSHWSPGR